MDREPTPETLATRSEYWALTRERIREEAARGDSNTLDITIKSVIDATTSRCICSNDPPSLFDYDIHFVWYTVLLAAQKFNVENPKQDTLLRHILYARELGALSRGLPKAEEGSVLARTSNGQRIWIDLPFLVKDFYQSWSEDSISMSTACRRNLASFTARLASVGICGDALTGCALLLFSDALETPRRLTTSESGSEVPIEDFLPALAVWLTFASHKLASMVKKSFDGFDNTRVAALGELARRAGVIQEGFSPSRWAFWRTRLTEISSSGLGAKASDILQLIEEIDNNEE